LNKQIKILSERAPRSTLELVDARLKLKFRLGRGGLAGAASTDNQERGAVKSKYSMFKHVTEKVSLICQGHWDNANDVISAPGRFAAPEIPPGLKSSQEYNAAYAKIAGRSARDVPARTLCWAASYVALWKHKDQCLEDRALVAYCVTRLRGGDQIGTAPITVYVPSQKVNSIWWFRVLTMDADGHISMGVQQRFVHFLSLLAPLYDYIHARVQVHCLRRVPVRACYENADLNTLVMAGQPTIVFRLRQARHYTPPATSDACSDQGAVDDAAPIQGPPGQPSSSSSSCIGGNGGGGSCNSADQVNDEEDLGLQLTRVMEMGLDCKPHCKGLCPMPLQSI
jgi:hypothetical protein